MGLELEPGHERRLRQLAKRQGCTPETLLEEIVEKALFIENKDCVTPPLDDEEETCRQRTGLREFLAQIESLPCESPDDGWDSSRHDEIIYRIDW